jgi:superfamily II DNA/RNA helicase
MLDLIEPSLRRRRIGYVRLDGSVPQGKRQPLVHAFQTDSACRVLLTTNAGSTGLNLQAADTVINVDLPWNPAVLEQRIARAHRMGQKRPVHVFVLVTEGTIEENLMATLSAKHELALAALDSESEVDAVELASGVEELKRRLEILLGAAPEAPVDESQRTDREAEAERLAGQRSRIAAAGGQLVTAAFTLLGELLPGSGNAPEAPEARQVADFVRTQLARCIERDGEGRTQLTVTLPDPAALDTLANSLGRLLSGATPSAHVN